MSPAVIQSAPAVVNQARDYTPTAPSTQREADPNLRVESNAEMSSSPMAVQPNPSSPVARQPNPSSPMATQPNPSSPTAMQPNSSTAAQAPTQPPVSKPVKTAGFVAPKIWMMVFGVVLAFCAGAVDTVTFRGLRVFTSHVTGTVAKVGLRLEGVTTGLNQGWDAVHSFMLLGSFIMGSFLCGLVIPKNQVHFGGKSFYGLALLGNSALLITSAVVGPRDPPVGQDITDWNAFIAGCLAAMACGLQNAMCTMHFGAVVRTTHVTGTATDIGSTAGRATMILLRKSLGFRDFNDMERADLRDDFTKLRVLTSLFVGFGCGTMFGAFMHSIMGLHALLVPAAITGTTGFTYMFFRSQMKKQIKMFEERRLKQELCDIDAALHRAHSFLEAVSQTDEELTNLDDIIEHSLEVMHDVEATIEELFTPQIAARETIQRSRTL